MINLWESPFADSYEYINNINDLFKIIKNEKLSIRIKTQYAPADSPLSVLESVMQTSNIGVKYTDLEHPIVIDKANNTIIISPEEFEKNKDIIVNEMEKRTLSSINNNETKEVLLYNFIFNDDILNMALASGKSLELIDVNLNDDQLEKIRKSQVDVYLYKDGKSTQISSKKILGHYSKEELENEMSIITLSSNINSKELENLKYINDAAKVYIKNNDTLNDDYYQNIFRILKYVDNSGKNFKVIFPIDSRVDFSKFIPEIEKYKNKNIELAIDSEGYSIEEYIAENNQLEKLISDIKDSKMSKLEKYLSVYNIVKKFKPYKEIESNLIDDKMKSRSIKHLLDNDYMVCVGYSNLLVELLERVGIEAREYSKDVYKYEDKQAKFLDGHARTIVNLEDEKYGINGYFIADATWDNNRNIGDTYNFALRPFDSMQQDKDILFKLQDIDYILDNHSFEEYVQRVNLLLNKIIKTKQYPILSNDKNQIKLNAYSVVFNIIIDFLKTTDNKAFKSILDYLKVDTFNRDEKFYEKFLTEIGQYIVSKSNNDVHIEDIAKAAANAKYYNQDVPNALKNEYADYVIKNYNIYNNKYFLKWESEEEKQAFFQKAMENQEYFIEHFINQKGTNNTLLKGRNYGFISILALIIILVFSIGFISFITYYLINKFGI